eukprot:UN16274
MDVLKPVKTLNVIKQHKQVYSGDVVQIHPNGEYIFCKNEDSVSILNLKNGENIKNIEAGEDPITHFCISPNGLYYVLSCKSTLIKVYDVRDNSCVREFRGHNMPVTSMTFDPTSTLLATAAPNRTVKIT